MERDEALSELVWIAFFLLCAVLVIVSFIWDVLS